MAMSDDRFRVIRAQLELYEQVDPHVTDRVVAQDMFGDARRLLRELVNAAEEGGVLLKHSPRVVALVVAGLMVLSAAAGVFAGYLQCRGR